MSFRQYITDLTVDTGSGNPGAIGIAYHSSNSGSVREVTVRSGDGSGVTGIDMTRPWPGPLMLRSVSVDGFNVGIDIGTREYGPVLENIKLRNQREVGIRVTANTVSIRRLSSKNDVPAIELNEGTASLVLLDSALEGAGNAAVVVNGGAFYARNIISTGYTNAAILPGGDKLQSPVQEFVLGNTHSLFTEGKSSLGLPIAEILEPPQTSQWTQLMPSTGYSVKVPVIQEALDSGASHYYLTGHGARLVNGTVSVPESVKMIDFNHQALNGEQGRLVLEVEGQGCEPLLLQGAAYGVTVVQNSKRPLILREGRYDLVEGTGSAPLMLEDTQLTGMIFESTPQIWARQLNTEGLFVDRLPFGPLLHDNRSADFWILGYKTEGPVTVMKTSEGARTEILGTLFYPTTSVPKNIAALVVENAELSAIASINGGYEFVVKEVRNGETKTLPRSALDSRTLELFTTN